MRKKSLRAMESAVFQAPESRAEAIMQNILGANNVLVPPEAPFEEILQAILYNTPYTKEAEARIEEILLAIKNNGTYYGEPQSRDEEILISKLKQTPYTKDAESKIEELFILWAAQSIVKQLEGVPPLAFTAQGQPLINWTIYGKSGGVGDKTANLFDYQQTQGITDNCFINQSGQIVSHAEYYISYPIYVTSGETYTWQFNRREIDGRHTAPTVGYYDANDNLISAAQHNTVVLNFVFTTPQNCAYIKCSVYKKNNLQTQAQLNEGSTALPDEPYGYKIPVSCGGETNTIYLDTPLYDGNSISMADTGIEIPTTNGQNTLAVDTTVQPEKVYIEYK